jgi:enoyl-CoA hydratase
LEVAMACDLRIASSESKFGMPEVAVGIPSVIHAALMPRLIGVSRATWLLLSAEIIDSEKAERWGLVQEVCPPQQLDGRIAAIAQRLAGFGTAALQQQKALLRAWEDAPLDDAIDATVLEFGKAFATGEPQHHMGEFIARKKR